ncbi:LysR family transcriptional regulator [Nocardia sp. NPDC059240]|uniref:LysR family transcriptional regulator n=1 Tax=Nocardia sp. NPDC059240 TaxID=3346786 RepID=UPI0036CCBDE8
MELIGVRTFVAVAEAGQFQEAALTLSITQQAVSKRIATLEKDLGTRLFARTARGAELTLDGQTFLPHALELLRVAARAAGSVRPGQRGLRVDVVARRIKTSGLLQDFHRAHPAIELDVVTLEGDLEAAVAAVEAGAVDATFHAVPAQRRLPTSISATPVIAEPHQVLVGPRHPLADADAVTPAQLAAHRIWMPGLPTSGEVADYYAELAATFDLTIDTSLPIFAKESLLEDLSHSPDLTMLVGEGTQYLWPDSYDLRRIPLRDPTPIYPMSLIWRTDNPHPALTDLRAYLDIRHSELADTEYWTPTWRYRAAPH